MKNIKNDLHKELREMRHGYTNLERYRDAWNEQDIEELKAMFDDGIGISEIAVALDRSERAVFQRMNTMGLFRKTNKSRTTEPKCGCLCGECPEKLGCSRKPQNEA